MNLKRNLAGRVLHHWTGLNHDKALRRLWREMVMEWRAMEHANTAIIEGKALAHLQDSLAAISTVVPVLEVSSDRAVSDPILHVIVHDRNGSAEDLRRHIPWIVCRISDRYHLHLEVRVSEDTYG